MFTNSQHAKNEQLWASKGWNTLLKWWLFLVKLLRRNVSSFNLLPYFGSWNLANHLGKTWNDFLISWNWKTISHKHWSNSTNWQIVESMHRIVEVKKAMYIIINYDEVITIDNRSWCSMHTYVVDGFKRMSLLLNLEKVISGCNVDNLTQLIMKFLMEYGCLTTN